MKEADLVRLCDIGFDDVASHIEKLEAEIERNRKFKRFYKQMATKFFHKYRRQKIELDKCKEAIAFAEKGMSKYSYDEWTALRKRLGV